MVYIGLGGFGFVRARGLKVYKACMGLGFKAYKG